MLVVIMLYMCYNTASAEQSETDILKQKLKLTQQTLTRHTAELAQIKVENTDLWKKIEALEESAKKHSNEIRDCQEDSKRHEESEEYYKKELANFFVEVSHMRKTTYAAEQQLSACLESNKVKSGLPNENVSPDGSIELQEKILNCEETVKVIRERCDRDSGELQEIQSTHNKIRKKEAECSQKLTRCTADKDHLEFLKRGYDVVVQELETDEKNANEAKARCEEVSKVAVAGAASYQLYLTTVGIAGLIYGTIKIYGFINGRLKERKLAMAAAKKQEKELARKKAGRAIPK